MNKNYTLTIGIPAYNEEANIISLLKTLEKQNIKGFSIEKIVVVSDGSTDSTENIVKEYAKNHKNVILLADGKRLGKAIRLNQLFQEANTDLFMLIDADIAVKSTIVLSNAISYFNNINVEMVGFNAQPVKTRNIIGTFINEWDYLWYKVRKDINGGNNIHNTKGAGFIVRTNLLKDVIIPSTLQQVARFLYLLASSQDKDFMFAKNAVIYYRSPETFSEYISVLTRGDVIEKKFFEDKFGSKIEVSYIIPISHKLKMILTELVTKPLLFIPTIIFIEFCYFWSKNKNSLEKPGIWKTTSSTKKLFI